MKKTITSILILSMAFILSGCFKDKKSDTNSTVKNTEIEEVSDNLRPKTILALGDSLTAGYTLPLEDSYPSQLEVLLQENNYNYELINAGVSGNTSGQALQRLSLYLEDEENLPELAIVVLGGNDGLQGKSISSLKDNLLNIIEKLQAKGVTVVLGGMQIPPNRGLSYFREFKGVYGDVAEETDVILIDFFLEDVATKGVYNLPDGIHPNKDGYAIIAENTFNFLKKNKLLDND